MSFFSRLYTKTLQQLGDRWQPGDKTHNATAHTHNASAHTHNATAHTHNASAHTHNATAHTHNATANTRSRRTAKNGTVFAIGDVHSDLKALREILENVICVSKRDETGAWQWNAPPNTTVLLLGDIVDGFRNYANRGCTSEFTVRFIDAKPYMARKNEIPFEEVEIFEMLNELEHLARANNSQVLWLFGNHELFAGNMMQNDYDDVLRWTEAHSSPYQLKVFGGVDARIEAFRPNGVVYNAMAPHRLATELTVGGAPSSQWQMAKIIIQLGSTVFVHGGLRIEHIELAEKHNQHLYAFANQTFNEVWLGSVNIKEAKFVDLFNLLKGENGDTGLLTSRELAENYVSANKVDQLFQRLNDHHTKYQTDYAPVKHIVVGHTPQVDGVNGILNDRVFRIDCAISLAIITPTHFKECLKITTKDNDEQFKIVNLC